MLGKNIKKFRNRRGLTQEQLGEMVGTDHSLVGKWERGEAEPRPATKKRLAEIFDVPIAALYTENPPGTNPAGDDMLQESSTSAYETELQRAAHRKEDGEIVEAIIDLLPSSPPAFRALLKDLILLMQHQSAPETQRGMASDSGH